MASTRSLGTLTLDLIAKTGGFVEGMTKAERASEKASKKMREDMSKLGKAAGVVIAGIIAGFGAMVKSSINTADAISKQSQQVGLSVERLSELKHTADLSGVSFEGLSSSLGKFNRNISDTLRTGTGPAANAFADLGIELHNAQGELKSTDDLLYEVAGAMSQLRDGATKTAIAQELFGRSGMQLIPMLNGGAEGMRAAAEEARRLGQVYTTDGAKKAEEFNDNLSRLRMTFTGVANTAAMEMTPALADLTSKLADPEFQQGINDLVTGLVKAGTAAVTAVAEIGNLTRFLAEETAARVNGANADDIVRLEDQLKRLQEMRDRGPITAGSLNMFGYAKGWVDFILKDTDEIDARIEETKRQIEDFWKTSKTGADGSTGSVNNLNKSLEKNTELTQEQIEEQRRQREIEEARKKLQEDLAKNADQMIANLEREIALYGDKTRLAAINYEIEKGIYKDLDPARKQTLKDLQAQLDLMDELFAEPLDLSYVLEPTKGAAKEVEDIYTGMFERISGYGADMLYGFATDSENIFGGVRESFTRMLSEIANEALLKPILLKVQTQLTGGAATGQGETGSGGAGNLLGMAAGGWAALAGVAVVGAVNSWNKRQEEQFKELTAEYRQGNQSTGTLLGMANMKSDSIANILDEMSSKYSDVLSVNYGMYRALLDIRTGITGVATGFVRTGFGGGEFNVRTGTRAGLTRIGSMDETQWAVDAFQDKGQIVAPGINEFIDSFLGGLMDSINKEIFKKKVSISDSGLQILGGTLADILEGGLLGAVSYADVRTTKKFLGVTVSDSIKTLTEDLDEIFLTQLSGVFASAGDALQMASATFGIDFDAYLSQLLIDPQKLSLKDLEGEALTKEIEQFFSSTLDNWAGVLLDGSTVLADFQQIGEGAFETMLRLATQTEHLAQLMAATQTSFGAAGMDAIYLTQQLAELSGGFDVLTSNLGVYYDKFFTEQEKMANLSEQLTEALAGVTDTLPQTRDQFRAMLEQLAAAGDAEAYATLLALAGSFDALYTSMERTNAAAEQALAQQQNQLDALMAPIIDQLAKNGLGEFEAALYDLDSALEDTLQKARDLGASEEQLAQIRAASTLDLQKIMQQQSDAALGALRLSIDAEAETLRTQFDASMAALTADFDARSNSLGNWLDTQLAHYERRAGIVSESIRELTSLSGALGSALGSLRIESDFLRGARYDQASAQIGSISADFLATGNLPGAELIQRLTQDLAGGAEFYSTFEDYADATASTLQSLAGLKNASDSQLSIDEQTLQSINAGQERARENHERMMAQLQADRDAQVAALEQGFADEQARLEAIYTNNVDQINALRGIDTSVKTVEEAVAGLREAVAGELETLRKIDEEKYDEMLELLARIAISTSQTEGVLTRQENGVWEDAA